MYNKIIFYLLLVHLSCEAVIILEIIYNALKLTKKISKSHNEILKWFVDLKTAQTFVLAICKKDSYTYISFWTIYLKIELTDGFATILNYLNVIPPAQICAED